VRSAASFRLQARTAPFEVHKLGLSASRWRCTQRAAPTPLKNLFRIAQTPHALRPSPPGPSHSFGLIEQSVAAYLMDSTTSIKKALAVVVRETGIPAKHLICEVVSDSDLGLAVQHPNQPSERLPMSRTRQSFTRSNICRVCLRETECRSNGGDCHGRELRLNLSQHLAIQAL
jgi:hypothetical protein